MSAELKFTVMSKFIQDEELFTSQIDPSEIKISKRGLKCS